MRFGGVLLAVVAIAVTLGCAARASTAARPTLRVLDSSPLTVRGASFKRGELVRVSYRSDGEVLVRRAVASRAGSFVVRFAGIEVHPCSGSGFVVTARGASGDAAAAKLPQTLCPPPLSP